LLLSRPVASGAFAFAFAGVFAVLFRLGVAAGLEAGTFLGVFPAVDFGVVADFEELPRRDAMGVAGRFAVVLFLLSLGAVFGSSSSTAGFSGDELSPFTLTVVVLVLTPTDLERLLLAFGFGGGSTMSIPALSSSPSS
jgi:hypothetical protein